MDWISNHLWESWLIAAVALGVVEMISLDLIFAMLAVGTAVGLLAFLRPNLIKSLHAGPDLRTGPAALIGRPVQVLTALKPHQTGRVKIGGDEWTAAPYDEFDEIEPGERAEVVEIRGATAYVRRA